MYRPYCRVKLTIISAIVDSIEGATPGILNVAGITRGHCGMHKVHRGTLAVLRVTGIYRNVTSMNTLLDDLSIIVINVRKVQKPPARISDHVSEQTPSSPPSAPV